MKQEYGVFVCGLSFYINVFNGTQDECIQVADAITRASNCMTERNEGFINIYDTGEVIVNKPTTEFTYMNDDNNFVVQEAVKEGKNLCLWMKPSSIVYVTVSEKSKEFSNRKMREESIEEIEEVEDLNEDSLDKFFRGKMWW